jgi:hypothetical protein
MKHPAFLLIVILLPFLAPACGDACAQVRGGKPVTPTNPQSGIGGLNSGTRTTANLTQALPAASTVPSPGVAPIPQGSSAAPAPANATQGGASTNMIVKDPPPPGDEPPPGHPPHQAENENENENVSWNDTPCA